MDYMELAKMAIPLLAIGGAWGGAKAAINGTRKRVQDIESDLKDSAQQRTDMVQRMTRVETKIDILLEKK